MSKTVRKISFFSAVIITLGATIGAGIFVKNDSLLQLTKGKIPFLIATWIIGGIGITALGLAIFEIDSVSESNRGVLEWSKHFLPKWLHTSATRYIVYFYYPAKLLALPLIVIQQIQATAGFNLSGWLVALIALFMMTWTLFMTGLSLKTGERLQWVVTILKFIPLFCLPIFALINREGPVKLTSFANTGLSSSSVWLGMIATIPVVAFAFDGFYRIAPLKNNLKQPKGAPKVILTSILITIVIYLFFSLSILFGTPDGKYSSLKLSKTVNILFRSLICVAVYGIVNGYCMAGPNVYESLWKNNEIKKPNFLKRFKKPRWSGTIYLYLLSLIYYVVIVPIGIFTFHATKENIALYGQTASSLYLFNDYFVNWIAFVIFCIICMTIFSGLVNRKTKKIKTTKHKYFIVAAIISTSYIFIGFIYSFIEQLVNMFGFNGANQVEAGVEMAILMITVIGSIYPLIFAKIKKCKKRRIGKVDGEKI